MFRFTNKRLDIINHYKQNKAIFVHMREIVLSKNMKQKQKQLLKNKVYLKTRHNIILNVNNAPLEEEVPLKEEVHLEEEEIGRAHV